MKHYFFGSYPLLPPSIGREGDLDRYLLRMKGKEGDWKRREVRISFLWLVASLRMT